MHRIWDYKNAFRILKGGKISLVVSAFLTTASIVNAAPTGGNVTSGNATISQNGNVTNINQSSNKASINWQDFSIGKNETVNFNQPNSNSITLNKVVGTSNSLIQGAMNANGQVILVNPNGVVFTEGSNVNVGGLIATTKNITEQDFQNDNYKFEGDSSASIINKGTINAKYVAMMGKEVVNEGKIVATMGRVELAGGDKFTLNLNGDSLLKLTIDEGTLNALVENKGLIKADGGVVYLTTKAVDSILDGMVNNTGIIEAQTLNTNDKGEIVLFAHGGTANVAGEIKAEGGFVETSGAKVDLKDDLKIKTKNWLIDPYDIEIVSDSVTETSITPSGGTYTAPSDSTKIKASTLTTALNAGTDVTVTTAGAGAQNGDITVNSTISWTSDSDLTLRADRNININQDITATGANAKLTLEYGQANVTAGNTADYNILRNVKINLQDGQNFTTKLGSDASTGNGGQVDYQVYNTALDLNNAVKNWNSGANVALGSDLNLADFNWSTQGYFGGKIAGLGHTFDNLTNSLFPSTNNATIRDLGLINVNINGGSELGALIGNARNTTIKNVFTTGNIISTGTDVGGLVGYMREGSIVNSYSTVNVSATNGSVVGGLVGHLTEATITNSYASGNVSAIQKVGGLVGEVYGGTLQNVYAIGNVTASDPVNWNKYAGGLVGYVDTDEGDFILTNAYASGAVAGSGASVGGLIGEIMGEEYDDIITNAYFDSTTTGQTFSAGGTAITNANAYTKTNYNFTNFDDNWFMVDGYTRPFLRSEWTTAVRNAHELQLMSMNLTQDYKLVGNIDLAPSLTNASEMWKDNSVTVDFEDYKGSFVPVGNYSNSSNYFTGSFDGLNNTILNLHIYRPSTSTAWGLNVIADNVGLFGYAQTSEFKNLTLENVNITGRKAVGGLVGEAHNTNISNITINGGTVTGSAALNDSRIGGLAGFVAVGSHGLPFNAYEVVDVSSSATISSVGGEVGGLIGAALDMRSSGRGTLDIIRASATGNVTSATERAGGLLGYWSEGVLRDSFATGDVSGGSNVGGLVGLSDWSSTIQNSYATGYVTATGDKAGGLVGWNYGQLITHSYATGDVTGRDFVGGLVGANEGVDSWGSITQIENSYATGSVVGRNQVGGLVGRANVTFNQPFVIENTALIHNSYHETGTVTGEDYVGGLVGYSGGVRITESYASSNATGINYVAGLVASTLKTSISDSYATGNVVSTSTDPEIGVAGGLVGELVDSSIIDSYATGNVNGLTALGGLVGTSFEGEIIDSYATGDVTATGFEDEDEGIAVGSAGGLVGEMYGGSITGSHAEGKVVGTVSVGGLVGLTDSDETNGEISNSYATGDVEGDWSVGGLIGDNYTAEITRTYATGNVTGIGTSNKQIGGLIGSNYAAVTESYATGDVEGAEDVGGLIGGNSEAVISRSFATGSVTGVDSDYYDNIDIGGLVGYNYGGAIVDSYATGAVSGTEKVGGLVGWNDGNSTVSSITNSYAVGSVTGTTAVGGLVGDNTDGLIYDSFWDTQTSGRSNGVGVAGTVDNATGKTTVQMKTLATYPQGDGEEIMGWEIVTDSSLTDVYPQLRWATDGLGNGTSVWVIGKTGLTYVVTGGTKTYGETFTLPNPTFVGGTPSGNATVKVYDAQNNDVTSQAIAGTLGAGIYTVKTLLTDTNYAIASSGNVDGTLVVGKANLTYTTTGGTKTYGETFTLPNPSFTGGTPSGNATVKVFDANNNDVTAQAIAGTLAVGTYTVKTVSLNDNNYGIASSGNVDGILTIVADNSGNNGNSENPNKEIEKQEQKVNNIITNIVNNAVKPNLPVLSLNPIRTDVVNGFERRVNSTIVNNRPQIGNENTLGTLNLGLNEIIRSVKPAVNEIVKENKLTIVGETGGESKIEIVELQDLLAKSGGGELRVALSPNSFVELVNGGVNLPDGVSQEFYVVEDKK